MWPKKRSLLLVNFGLDNGSRGTGDQQQVPKLTPDGKIVGQNTRTKAASYKMAKKNTFEIYVGLIATKTYLVLSIFLWSYLSRTRSLLHHTEELAKLKQLYCIIILFTNTYGSHSHFNKFFTCCMTAPCPCHLWLFKYWVHNERNTITKRKAQQERNKLSPDECAANLPAWPQVGQIWSGCFRRMYGCFVGG